MWMENEDPLSPFIVFGVGEYHYGFEETNGIDQHGLGTFSLLFSFLNIFIPFLIFLGILDPF